MLSNYGTVIVRSSKQPNDFITIDADEWFTFLAGVKNGDFD